MENRLYHVRVSGEENRLLMMMCKEIYGFVYVCAHVCKIFERYAQKLKIQKLRTPPLPLGLCSRSKEQAHNLPPYTVCSELSSFSQPSVDCLQALHPVLGEAVGSFLAP